MRENEIRLERRVRDLEEINRVLIAIIITLLIGLGAFATTVHEYEEKEKAVINTVEIETQKY